MNNLLSVRLMILFSVSFSLVVMSGSLASYDVHFLPSLYLARANPAPVVNWYPAGPAMDTLKFNIYTDATASDGALQAEQVDLEDEAIQSRMELSCLLNGVGCVATISPADFSVTAPISAHDYFELQFDLSNNFWGCQFNFGNSACGVNIRQAIAHLVDKNIFAATAQGLVNGFALDNPVPSSLGLPTANPCAWDTLFPETTGPVGPCEVGPDPVTGQAGGVAYHLATATACGVSGGCGTNLPLFAWEPGLGTPDFCAAIAHLIVAGVPVASMAGASSCTGLPAGTGGLGDPKAHTVNVFTRTQFPRHELGNGLSDEICAIFTGVFRQVGVNPMCPNVSATNLNGYYVTQFTGLITAFPGFTTSTTNTINNDWWIYTAAFLNVQPFDTFYGIYDSAFADNNGINAGTFGVGDVPPCSTSSVSTSGASDYMYNCQTTYDQLANAMEFAPCLGAGGDPTPGQTTPTFADCSGGSPSGNCPYPSVTCSAVSAGYQVEDLHGRTVVTLPVFGSKFQDAYLSNWSRVIPDQQLGIANYFSWLNMWTNTPASSGLLVQNCPTAPAVIGPDCIRSAMSQNTDGLNPYTSNSPWDRMVIANIWDSLIRPNPMNSAQLFSYMATGFPTSPKNVQLGYTPALGTTISLRFTLRNDIFFHDGTPLTAFDVKYSYLTFQAIVGPIVSGLVQVTDVHVLSTTTFDVNLSTLGAFTLSSIGALPILPGRHWSAGGLAAWDSALNKCKTSTTPDACFSAADLGAFSPAAGVTSPLYDPLGSGNLIGSGPWECVAVPGLPNPSGHAIGGGCSSTGVENPGVGGYYQLTQFGAGQTPGTGLPSGQYFRSSGKLAVYIWSGNNGGATHDFLNTSTVASCFLKPVGTVGCTQWQQGIGNPAAPPGAPVGFLQISAAASFNGVHWTAPFDYLPGIAYPCCSFTPNAPTQVAPPPLLLYAGVSNGNSGNPFPSGTQEILSPAATAGCTVAYPTGGYDC